MGITGGIADIVMFWLQLIFVGLIVLGLASAGLWAFRHHGKWMLGAIIVISIIVFFMSGHPSRANAVDQQIAEAQHRSAQLNALNNSLSNQPGTDLEKWLRDGHELCTHAVNGRLSDCMDLVRNGTFTSFNDGGGVIGIRVQKDTPNVSIGKRLTLQRTGKSNTVVDLREGDKLRLDLTH